MNNDNVKIGEKEFYDQLEDIKNKLVIDRNKPPFCMVNIAFFRNTKHTLIERAVYIDLLCYAGSEKNTAFPSVKTIAKDIGVSPRSVTTAIKSLEEKNGILVINRVWDNKAKTSNMYVLAELDLLTGEFKESSLENYKVFKNKSLEVYKKRDNEKNGKC